MADGRFYEFTDDDRKYVSVTTFLNIIGKPFLVSWAAKKERELIKLLASEGKALDDILGYLDKEQPYAFQLYNESRAEHGNVVHKAIDYTLKKLKLPKMNKAEKKAYKKWEAWWNAQGYELIGAEQVIKCEYLGYAGTLDALVKTKEGQTLILDWKTGKSHYSEHVLQNLAYQNAQPADGGLLVYIPDEYLLTKELEDKGFPPEKIAKMLEKKLDIFTHDVPQVTPELMEPVLAALKLWRWNANKPWKEAA
jgi:hypothetical protein